MHANSALATRVIPPLAERRAFRDAVERLAEDSTGWAEGGYRDTAAEYGRLARAAHDRGELDRVRAMLGSAVRAEVQGRPGICAWGTFAAQHGAAKLSACNCGRPINAGDKRCAECAAHRYGSRLWAPKAGVATCAQCNKAYTPTRSTCVYCGPACAYESKRAQINARRRGKYEARKPVQKSCRQCGKRYLLGGAGVGWSYCSGSCRAEGTREGHRRRERERKPRPRKARAKKEAAS